MNVSMRNIYGETLVELGKKYNDLVVLDADLAESTKTRKFADVFPERFFDMGVSEQDMMGTAAGLAASGKIVFASSFAIFATGRAYEQVRNTICYSNLPVNIVATHGGISVGPDGSSHQPLEDVSLMRAIPNMSVFVPADAIQTRETIKAVVKYKGPTYTRLSRLDPPLLFDDRYEFSEKATKMRDGSDLAIIACGLMVDAALRAAEKLKKKRIDAAVLNVHSIKPIDEKSIVRLAKKAGKVLTVEEHSVYGGLGSAVAEVLVENYPVPVRRIGTRTFGESGKPKELLKKYGLDEENIFKIAKKFVGGKK